MAGDIVSNIDDGGDDAEMLWPKISRDIMSSSSADSEWRRDIFFKTRGEGWRGMGLAKSLCSLRNARGLY